MGKYAGSMRTRALSGAETIHVNGEVLEYLIQGNQHVYCAVHTPQCRTYGTMPYAVCRMKYAVREYASSLVSVIDPVLWWVLSCLCVCTVYRDRDTTVNTWFSRVYPGGQVAQLVEHSSRMRVVRGSSPRLARDFFPWTFLAEWVVCVMFICS